MAHVGRLVADADDPVGELASLEGSDLLLAFACLSGVSGAIATFEREHDVHVRTACARMGSSALPLPELRQAVRSHVFAPRAKAQPAIASYSGHGPLGAWFRITTSRVAMMHGRDAGRRRRHESAIEQIAAEIVGGNLLDADPELRVLLERCQQALRAALVTSADRLDGRQRAVLRLSLSERHSVRQIGKMYGVHHSTVARWVRDAYAQLVDGVRQELAQGLGVDEPELQSLMRAVRSHLDFTLNRALAADDG